MPFQSESDWRSDRSLAYVIVFFMLLALRSWNRIAIDAAIETPPPPR